MAAIIARADVIATAGRYPFDMKRYRIFGFDFDARANFLAMNIADHWEPLVKESNLKAQNQIKLGLLREYGPHAAEEKLKNFIDIEAKPLSILAFHNKFLTQVREAFVISAYYPALTAACALGERILNHLMFALRDDFKGTPEYKKVYNKDGFGFWDVPINTLESWDVLVPEVVKEFHKLHKLRNAAIHFKPEVDTNDRPLALGAIKSLQSIVNSQFGAFGVQPWFMVGTPGETYLKNEWLTKPFIQKVYVPNCREYGPAHWVVSASPWVIEDRDDYEDRQVTDEEFISLRKTAMDERFTDMKLAADAAKPASTI